MSKLTSQRRYVTLHIDLKFRRSLRLLLVISVVVLGFVVNDLFRDDANVLLVLLALLIGAIVGYISSRMYKLSWDEAGKTIIKRIDIYGFVILILFILFEIFRKQILGIFIDDTSSIPAMSLALLAGALYGRTMGSVRTIVRMVKQQHVFSID